jgi:DNA-binding MarR family transcriptional regulator
MNVHEAAIRLESLLPQVMTVLFHSAEEDPLRHHSVGQIRLIRSLLAGSKSASELSQALGLSPSSLTQMSSRMILAGLISKELDPQDRRVRKLSLTPAGRSLMQGRQAVRARAASSVLEKWPEEKCERIVALLEELTQPKTQQGYALVEAL